MPSRSLLAAAASIGAVDKDMMRRPLPTRGTTQLQRLVTPLLFNKLTDHNRAGRFELMSISRNPSTGDNSAPA